MSVYLSAVVPVFDEHQSLPGLHLELVKALEAVALLVGVQLIGTGFLGDALRHSNTRERQPYRIRQVIGPSVDGGAVGQKVGAGPGRSVG